MTELLTIPETALTIAATPKNKNHPAPGEFPGGLLITERSISLDQQFLRLEMLLGEDAMAVLGRAHVAVFGIGGVGSWCAEALVRAGVGRLTLVDHDTVGVTNLNRQIEALHSTLNQPKVLAMANRIGDINPDCQVQALEARYTPDERDAFFQTQYDYLVDAIDLVSCKLDLIQTAMTRNIPIVSALGTGNKLDPTQFQVADLSKTYGCPLARIVRKELGKQGIRHHKVVFSPELPHATDQKESPPPGRRSVPASVPWVPPVAGFLLAGEVVKDLTRDFYPWPTV